jgi:hypothetical protein
MLPVTVSDETGSLDATAFSMVAEDLVEKNTYLASQNMKIDALDHIATLDTAIGKTRLPHRNRFKCIIEFCYQICAEKSYNVNPSECSASLQGPKVLHFECTFTQLTTITTNKSIQKIRNNIYVNVQKTTPLIYQENVQQSNRAASRYFIY